MVVSNNKHVQWFIIWISFISCIKCDSIPEINVLLLHTRM
jgi:hypothetical protein